MHKSFFRKSCFIIAISIFLLSFSAAQVFADPIVINDSIQETVGDGADDADITFAPGEGATGALSINLLYSSIVRIGDRGKVTVGSDSPSAFLTSIATSFSLGGGTLEAGTGNTITVNVMGNLASFMPDVGGSTIKLSGYGNKIINYGSIKVSEQDTSNGRTILFENTTLPEQEIEGNQNTIDNYGVIENVNFSAQLGYAIVSLNRGEVIVNNYDTGVIKGHILLEGGSNTLNLHAKSLSSSNSQSIFGNIAGEGLNNVINLFGDIGSSDVLNGKISGFQTLNKYGEGTWTLEGNIRGFDEVNVALGTLIISGLNEITIDDLDYVLETEDEFNPLDSTINLPLNMQVSQDSTVVFDLEIPLTTITLNNTQTREAMEYAGTISGDGGIVKVGEGTLILTIDNSYSGGTWIKEGELTIRSDGSGSDSALGSDDSPLLFGDTSVGGTRGTLTFLEAVDINANRNITLNEGGGVFYIRGILKENEISQDFIPNFPVEDHFIDKYLNAAADIYSVISGPGDLVKKGKGGLRFLAENTYTGDTYIEEGVLYIHEAFESPNVYISDNSNGNQSVEGIIGGEIAFYTNGFIYDGQISGAGRIRVQMGDVTLTNRNDFRGMVDVYDTLYLSGEKAYLSAETWMNVAVIKSDHPAVESTVGKLIIQGEQKVPVIELFGGAFFLYGELHLMHQNMEGYGLDSLFHGSASFVGDGKIYFKSGRTLLEKYSANFEGTSVVYDGAYFQLKSSENIAAALGGTTIISRGGTLEGSGYLGTVENSGTISLGFGSIDSDDVATRTLYLMNGYKAYEDAKLVIHTVLGDDDSLTDKLYVLGGGTEGHTLVEVHNYKGLGAKTDEGILVVQVDGGNSAGTFELSSNYIDPISGNKSVLGGAYAYYLEKDGNNWYLRNSFLPNVPVYETYSHLLLLMNDLPTLQQRVGNRMWVSDEKLNYMEKAGQWVRFDTSIGHFQSNSMSYSKYALNTFKVQTGLDRPLFKFDNGSWMIGGINASYSKGQSNIWAQIDLGNVNSDGFSIGGSATLYGIKGFYMDIQVQGKLFLSDVAVITNFGDFFIENHRGVGSAFGIEVGQRIDLKGNWSLTPQVQWISSKVRFTGFDDGLDYIELESGKSSLGRLSLAVNYEQSWAKSLGRADHLKAYGILNIYNEFSDGTVFSLTGEELKIEREKLWGGVAVGGTYSLNDGFSSVYGEFGVKTSFKNFWQNRIFTGIVGLRIKF